MAEKFSSGLHPLPGDLVLTRDAGAYTFLVAGSYIDYETEQGFAGDRCIPVHADSSSLVVRGRYSKDAGKLVGSRFKTFDQAYDAIQRFRNGGEL